MSPFGGGAGGEDLFDFSGVQLTYLRNVTRGKGFFGIGNGCRKIFVFVLRIVENDFILASRLFLLLIEGFKASQQIPLRRRRCGRIYSALVSDIRGQFSRLFFYPSLFRANLQQSRFYISGVSEG